MTSGLTDRVTPMRQFVGTRLKRIISLWDAVQVELHGCYSVERMRQLHEYSFKTSEWRVASAVLLTPLPCLAAVAFADCIPLQPPYTGIENSSGFWVRACFASWVYTISIMEQLRFFVPELPLTGRMTLTLSIPVMAATNSICFLLAWRIGFPLPFTLPIVSVPWSVFMVTSLWMQLRSHFRSDPTAVKRVLQFVTVVLCQLSLLLIYPAYNAAFLHLSSTAQTLFALLLPLIKLVEKNMLCAALRHADDLKPEIVIFNAEIFNALFIACCMQNSNSIGTNIVLVAVDFVMACASLRDLDLMLVDVNQLAAKLNIDQDQLVEAALQISAKYPGIEDRVSLKLLQERVERSQPQHTTKGSMFAVVPRPPVPPTKQRPNRIRVQPIDQVTTSQHVQALDAPQKVILVAPPLRQGNRLDTILDSSLQSIESSVAASPQPAQATSNAGSREHPSKSTATRAATSDDVMAAVAGDAVRSSVEALTDKERLLFLQKVLQSLHMTEYLLLVEYTEVMIPIVYSIYLVVLFHLPNWMYYPQLRHMDRTKLQLTIGNVMMNATCEFISLVLLILVLRKKLKSSPSRQLAFVLDCQWRMVQSKVVLWVVITLQSTLDHLGADYSFQFEWLYRNQTSI